MSRDPLDLHPVVRPYLARLQQSCLDRLGITLDVVETWRDPAAQAAALSAGASTKPAGTSWHNITYPNGKPCSFAFHVDPFPGPAVLGYGPKVLEWTGAHTMQVTYKPGLVRAATAPIMVLNAIGLIGEELGLTWGGRWERPFDPLHFELHPDGATQAQVQAAILKMGDIAFGGYRA